jgi:hypothetical protein
MASECKPQIHGKIAHFDCFIMMTEPVEQTSFSPVATPEKAQKAVLSHAEIMAAKRADNLRQNLARRKQQARSRQELSQESGQELDQ